MLLGYINFLGESARANLQYFLDLSTCVQQHLYSGFLRSTDGLKKRLLVKFYYLDQIHG